MANKTPEVISGDSAVFTIRVPNNVEIREVVRGAIVSITNTYHWEQASVTAATPEETVNAIMARVGRMDFTVE